MFLSPVPDEFHLDLVYKFILFQKFLTFTVMYEFVFRIICFSSCIPHTPFLGAQVSLVLCLSSPFFDHAF